MVIEVRDNDSGDNDSWDNLHNDDIEWFAEELSHLWDQVEVYDEDLNLVMAWLNGERTQ